MLTRPAIIWTIVFDNSCENASFVDLASNTLIERFVIAILVIECKQFKYHNAFLSRVDVSETFSADQLWFRIISRLFQRCSIPENLWTALIQLWRALKTKIFRAKNQRWNSADFLWNRDERRWFLRDSIDNFWFTFHIFEIFGSTSVLRHIIQIFRPICEMKLTTET